MDPMMLAMFLVAGMVVLALAGAVYLLFVIRNLLFQIASTLDSINKNSDNIALYLRYNPQLRDITRTLHALSRELRKYINRSIH